MATVDDFMRRQRAASARIIRGLGRIAQARDDFTQTTLRSVPAVVSAPGGQAGRAREAVRLVHPSLQTIEDALEEQTPEIMAAVAELSENWDEHVRIWDSLEPEQLPVVVETEESVTALHEALQNARESDRTFRESLENFAALGDEPAAAARGVMGRLEGIMAALAEYQSQVDESLETIRNIDRRLEE